MERLHLGVIRWAAYWQIWGSVILAWVHVQHCSTHTSTIYLHIGHSSNSTSPRETLNCGERQTAVFRWLLMSARAYFYSAFRNEPAKNVAGKCHLLQKPTNSICWVTCIRAQILKKSWFTLKYLNWSEPSKWRPHRSKHEKLPQRPRGGGGYSHSWEYWGCAAGQGAFLELPTLAQGVFFQIQKLAQGAFLSSNSGTRFDMFFTNFSGHFQPNFISIL